MSNTTIREHIEKRERVWVRCGSAACHHCVEIDLPALAERLGPDHGAMHDDLVGKFRCAQCREAGRPRSAPYFSLVVDYSRWSGRLNTVEVLPADRGG